MNFALLITMGAAWGLHFALMKMVASGEGAPLLLLFPTLAGISVGFALIVVARRSLYRPTWAHLRFFVISGLLGYLAPILLELIVAAKIDAGLLTLIVTTNPLITILVAGLMRTEVVRFRQILAAGLGAVAAAALLLPDSALPSTDMRVWVAAAFGIPSLYAVYNVYVAKAWPNDLDPLQVATGESIASALFAFPFFAWVVATSGAAPLAESPLTLVALILATTVEVWAFFELIRRAGAIFVSFSSFAALVGGISWGIFLFAEQMTLWMVGSCALVTASLFLLGSGSSTADTQA